MGTAWNHWYHVTAHTYGAWPHGDTRGWRSRHHRDHVDGDYKNPPRLETYRRLHAFSRKSMTRPAVCVQDDLKTFVLNAIIHKLQQDEIEILIACLDATHMHLLGRFKDAQTRHWVGRTKKNASHLLRQEGLRLADGGLWGKRSRTIPIIDRQHQLNVFSYIAAHASHGAAIWRFDRD